MRHHLRLGKAQDERLGFDGTSSNAKTRPARFCRIPDAFFIQQVRATIAVLAFMHSLRPNITCGKQPMSTAVSLGELVMAYEWVSAGESASGDCEAYVSRVSGVVHWCGDEIDEEPLDDVDDGSLYIAVPRRSELDLGRTLALRFVEAHLPGERETAGEHFRKRGAYARFKALLERAGQLDTWHQYEQDATEAALRAGCSDNGFTVSP